jgi:hypothetical protein
MLDKSGYDNHAVQAGADALKPSWAIDAAFNNRGVLNFDGARYLLGNMELTSANCVVACIAQLNTGALGSCRVFSTASASAGDTVSTDGFACLRVTTNAQMRVATAGFSGIARAITMDAPFVALFVKDVPLGGWSTAVQGNNLNVEAAPTAALNSAGH